MEEGAVKPVRVEAAPAVESAVPEGCYRSRQLAEAVPLATLTATLSSPTSQLRDAARSLSRTKHPWRSKSMAHERAGVDPNLSSGVQEYWANVTHCWLNLLFRALIFRDGQPYIWG